MRAHRARLDAAIDGWITDMPPGFAERTMRYSNTRGVEREHPMWQATTMLMQAGVDPGDTDLIALAHA